LLILPITAQIFALTMNHWLEHPYMFLSEDIDGKIGTHWRPKKQRDDTFEYVQSWIGWWWLLRIL